MSSTGHEPLISVVVPTITGREDWLERCRQAYERTTPGLEFIVVKDEPSCGHAWQKGYERSTGRYVHFTADDIEPSPHWWREAVMAVDRGEVPACNVRGPNGYAAHCDSPLADLGHLPNVLVPFLSREQLELGNWLLPIHYGSDDWVAYRAAQLGLKVRRYPGYEVTHHVAPEGRNYRRRHADVLALVTAMDRAGYVPPVYAQLERNLRTSETGLDGVSIKQLDRDIREQLRIARCPNCNHSLS